MGLGDELRKTSGEYSRTKEIETCVTRTFNEMIKEIEKQSSNIAKKGLRKFRLQDSYYYEDAHFTIYIDKAKLHDFSYAKEYFKRKIDDYSYSNNITIRYGLSKSTEFSDWHMHVNIYINKIDISW